LKNGAGSELKVYAVWVRRLKRDAPGHIDPAIFGHPAASVFWDGDQIAGKFFAAAEGFHSPVAWDSYYLYGPKVRWRAMAAPITASGFPVMNFRRDLRRFVRGMAEG
jgi:hypothetical protein